MRRYGAPTLLGSPNSVKKWNKPRDTSVYHTACGMFALVVELRVCDTEARTSQLQDEPALQAPRWRLRRSRNRSNSDARTSMRADDATGEHACGVGMAICCVHADGIGGAGITIWQEPDEQSPIAETITNTAINMSRSSLVKNAILQLRVFRVKNERFFF